MSTTATSHPVETILYTGLVWLLAIGIPWSVINFVFPVGDDPFVYVNVQLVLLQLVTLAFVIRIAPLTDRPWFSNRTRPWLASTASLVAAAVGFSALLTLATSAASRYDVSLQFLQLLSSMDIAWVVAALYLGSRMLWNKPVAIAVAVFMLAACVVSVAVYLNVVGFTASGGWLVDGSEMVRIVLPADTVAAVVSITVLLLGARRAQAMLQASPQS